MADFGLPDVATDDLALIAVFGHRPADEGESRTAWDNSVQPFAGLAKTYADLPNDPNNLDGAVVDKKRAAVKEALAALTPVSAQRDKLRADVNTARSNFEPAVPNDTTTSAAIWPRLPVTPLEARIAYVDAVEAGNFDVANAIETMPAVFSGSLGPDDLFELRDFRLLAEDPERHVRIVAATELLAEVEALLGAAAAQFNSQLNDLPDPPDPEAIMDDPLAALASADIMVEDA